MGVIVILSSFKFPFIHDNIVLEPSNNKSISTYYFCSGLEYLIQVFTLLSEAEDGYVLHELEASAFIPYLVNKMGDPKVCTTRIHLLPQMAKHII